LAEGDYGMAMDMCSSCIKKTTLWIKSVSASEDNVRGKSKKEDVKMVVKLLILTLITRAKLYQKQVKSNDESIRSN
jgi:hypothetical protein